MVYAPAQRYMRAIRNARKREYAWSYWRYLTSPARGAVRPAIPEGLSLMGAQAVEMRLSDFADEYVKLPKIEP